MSHFEHMAVKAGAGEWKDATCLYSMAMHKH